MNGACSPADNRRAPVFVFDLARALSALCVLAAHARGFVLADLPQQPALPFVGRVFFGLTALGHQAVIVFLVLSGTLVTGSVLAAFEAGRWSPAAFVLARLNRLWVVLLPCLLLGGLEDAVGLVLTDPHGGGPYGASASARTVLDRLDWTTLAGNALFLQGFRVPVFGTNIPLWSLSVEAWCYAAALAVALVSRVRQEPLRAGCIVMGTATVAASVLTPAFALIAPIWCVGAALAVVLRNRSRNRGTLPQRSPCRPIVGRIGTILFAAAALVAARILAGTHLVASDYLLALAVALVLAGLHDWRPVAGQISRAVRAVADVSFTLYLAHFPLLALLDAVVLHHRRLPWGASAAFVWLTAVVVALVHALVLWWLFERHTAALRAFWIARWAAFPRPVQAPGRIVLP